MTILGRWVREVGHPDGVESCQKSIGAIGCNLAISYNDWQHSLVFLDTTNETKRTKPYIEAAYCLKKEKKKKKENSVVHSGN